MRAEARTAMVAHYFPSLVHLAACACCGTRPSQALAVFLTDEPGPVTGSDLAPPCRVVDASNVSADDVRRVMGDGR